MDRLIHTGGDNTEITGQILRVHNSGTMGAISSSHTQGHIIINNVGTINFDGYNYNHLSAYNITIENYAITIDKEAIRFNSGDRPKDNSHLVVTLRGNSYNSKIQFQDDNSKLILDFGDRFELGKQYLLSKLIVNSSGETRLNVDLSRIKLKNSDIFEISQSGEYFIVNFIGGGNSSNGSSKSIVINTPITATSKAIHYE